LRKTAHLELLEQGQHFINGQGWMRRVIVDSLRMENKSANPLTISTRQKISANPLTISTRQKNPPIHRLSKLQVQNWQMPDFGNDSRSGTTHQM
jgi:hypothetical protein